MALVAVPIGFDLIVTAPALVPAVFGERWSPRVPPLSVLAPFSTLHAVRFHAGDVFKAPGKGALLTRLGLATSTVLVPLLLGGLFWLGVLGVALAWLADELLWMVLSLRAMRRELNVRPGDFFAQVRAPLLAGLGLLAAGWGVGQAVGGAGWPTLAAQVVAGAAAYLGAVLALDRELPRQLGRLLRGG